MDYRVSKAKKALEDLNKQADLLLLIAKTNTNGHTEDMVKVGWLQIEANELDLKIKRQT